MNYQQYIKVTLLVLGFISSLAFGQKTSPYNMEKIKDVSVLELKVLQEWHPAATTPPTLQKIVEITHCTFENGRKIRILVACVVPDHVKRVSMLRFQEGEKEGMSTYSSGNYTILLLKQTKYYSKLAIKYLTYESTKFC